MPHRVILNRSEEGYSVSAQDLPGCHSQGVDEQDALINIREAISEYTEVLDELRSDTPTS